MKKITKATLKSFVKRNNGKLFVNVKSSFDGMTDGCESRNDGFQPQRSADFEANTLGIAGIWLVGSSRDYFKAYDKDGYEGIEVSNCCGYFIVAVRKAA